MIVADLKAKVPLVCMTAYTLPIARIVDGRADLVLVGDSLGNVLYGMPTTVPVSLDVMIAHGRAVVSACEKALVCVDLPFGSYEESPQVAFRNAARVMKETGCAGVKLEGGVLMAETIAFLVQRGIPVFGHVGLMPARQGFRLTQGYSRRAGTGRCARGRGGGRLCRGAGMRCSGDRRGGHGGAGDSSDWHWQRASLQRSNRRHGRYPWSYGLTAQFRKAADRSVRSGAQGGGRLCQRDQTR